MTKPRQLQLFTQFLPAGDHRFGNTLEFYDAIPKHVRSSNRVHSERVDGKYLPILEREFHFRHRTTGETRKYRVEIRPARLKLLGSPQGSKEREFYPSAREELVEEALHKIAADTHCGVYLDNQAGVQFTLGQLRRELAARNHSLPLAEIKQALEVCHNTNVRVMSDNGDEIAGSTIFPVLLVSSRAQWLDEPGDAYCYVQFHPLLTKSINELTFRQFDYHTHMQCTNQLARWLHKRLSHNYVNANWSNAYTIKATTIIRDSCLINNDRFRDRLAAIEAALGQLVSEQVVLGFSKEPIRSNRKLIDAKFHVTPSPQFVDDMKLANKRLSEQRADSGE
ncbi:MAG: hypothetical protein KDB14_28370 [Planctomycetales bacterium]|nr:hypothetical protein [Planctomycetales bacterium]